MFLINWGELEGRTDVEFYVPSVLKYIERLKGMKHQKLLFISQKFANGSTPSEGKFEQTGVLYYRSQDIGLMEMQKKQYISEEFDEKLSRSRCRTGDVLVAIVGATLGRIGFIERDEQQGNINQNITKITISDLRFSPKFVAVFLDSKLGQIQLYRLSTKTAQSYLNNEQLGKVIIPTVCKSLQNDIVKAIEEAHKQAEKKKSEADELLNSINYYMLNALNIALPLKPCDDLANRIFYIKANDMLGGRFDPRKYSLKYKQLFEAIKSAPYNRMLLKEVVLNDVSGDWGLNDTVEDPDLISCLTIRGTEFDNKFNLNLDNNRTKFRKYKKTSFSKIELNEKDILIEKSGGSEDQPVGRVAFVEKDMLDNYPLAFSNFIHRIRIDDKKAVPEYVFEYLRLMHNIKITEVMQTQTNGIRNLIMQEYFTQTILLPEPKKQEEIAIHAAQMRKRAFELQMEAEKIVSDAKVKVETMLLEDEQ